MTLTIDQRGEGLRSNIGGNITARTVETDSVTRDTAATSVRWRGPRDSDCGVTGSDENTRGNAWSGTGRQGSEESRRGGGFRRSIGIASHDLHVIRTRRTKTLNRARGSAH